ncbi:unknown [Mycoplasma sp. CAG:956]|nr:unknown [Mycoplasma sp. CAG:956]
MDFHYLSKDTVDTYEDALNDSELQSAYIRTSEKKNIVIGMTIDK